MARSNLALMLGMLGLLAFVVAGFSLSMTFEQPALAATFTTVNGLEGAIALLNNDSSITFNTAVSHITATLNVGHTNTWTAIQNFNGGLFANTISLTSDLTPTGITENLGSAANYFNNLFVNTIQFKGTGGGLTGTYQLAGSPQFGASPTLASGVTLPTGTIFTCTIPSGTGLVNAATEYYMPQSTCPASSNEANVANYYPVKGLALNLFVAIQTAPGAGTSWVFSVKDSGNNALTCTISGASATTCSDTTHTEIFSAGDVISIRVTQTGAPAASGYALMSFQVEPEG